MITTGMILAKIYLSKYIRITNNITTFIKEKNTTEQGCIFFAYLKKIYIPPKAKNNTPTTSTKVGKVFARIKAGLPFPLIFLCCFAKFIAFI